MWKGGVKIVWVVGGGWFVMDLGRERIMLKSRSHRYGAFPMTIGRA